MESMSREWCSMRSDGLERMQQRADRRLDHHSKKLDQLSTATVQLAAAVDRVSQLLEKQDKRLDRLESRSPFAFLETNGGRMLLRFLGVGLLILLCAGVGVNVVQIIKEVLA